MFFISSFFGGDHYFSFSHVSYSSTMYSLTDEQEDELRFVFRTYMVLRLHTIYPIIFNTFYRYLFKPHIALKNCIPHKQLQEFAGDCFPPYEAYKTLRKDRLSYLSFEEKLSRRRRIYKTDLFDVLYVFEESCKRMGPSFHDLKICEENCIEYCTHDIEISTFLMTNTWEEIGCSLIM